jgi:hypothetical protein
MSSGAMILYRVDPLLGNVHETKPVAEQQILNKPGYAAVAG